VRRADSLKVRHTDKRNILVIPGTLKVIDVCDAKFVNANKNNLLHKIQNRAVESRIMSNWKLVLHQMVVQCTNFKVDASNSFYPAE